MNEPREDRIVVASFPARGQGLAAYWNLHRAGLEADHLFVLDKLHPFDGAALLADRGVPIPRAYELASGLRYDKVIVLVEGTADTVSEADRLLRGFNPDYLEQHRAPLRARASGLR